ncbi:conserved domain protein [Actinomyces sp. oral taxon 175 str. F0384]|nr:conserved domain protein [Actinomyces sp. oral taxon 175 str. F0384]
MRPSIAEVARTTKAPSAALVALVTAALVQVTSWAARTRVAPLLVAPICVVQVTRACGRSQTAGTCVSSVAVPVPVSARPIATGTARGIG